MLPFTLGVPNIGGSITTGGGVIFIGAAQDSYFRAYDTKTGQLLWQTLLPAGGQATPMTYRGRDGRQIVVIAAGGHDALAARRGDYVRPSPCRRKAGDDPGRTGARPQFTGSRDAWMDTQNAAAE